MTDFRMNGAELRLSDQGRFFANGCDTAGGTHCERASLDGRRAADGHLQLRGSEALALSPDPLNSTMALGWLGL